MSLIKWTFLWSAVLMVLQADSPETKACKKLITISNTSSVGSINLTSACKCFYTHTGCNISGLRYQKIIGDHCLMYVSDQSSRGFCSFNTSNGQLNFTVTKNSSSYKLYLDKNLTDYIILRFLQTNSTVLPYDADTCYSNNRTLQELCQNMSDCWETEWSSGNDSRYIIHVQDNEKMKYRSCCQPTTLRPTQTNSTTSSSTTSSSTTSSTSQTNPTTSNPTTSNPTTSSSTTSSSTTTSTTTLSASTPSQWEKNSEAKHLMENLTETAKSMCDNCTLPIETKSAKGLLIKHAKKASVKIGYDSLDKLVVADTLQESKWSVTVPEEAFSLARMQRNVTPFVGVVRFPELVKTIKNNDSTLYFKSDVFGIEMGVNITNLTNSIDIYFRNLSMTAANWTCMSSDSADTWTSSGCKTNFFNETIQCSCNHLTFFALLMAQPNQTISKEDEVSLTYITSIGCGLSTFFLIVGLFIHFVMRRSKTRVGTTILMHLFVALVLLNITFLSNQQVTNLNNSVSCVIIAAATHFSMLATFTWFFIQALHFYLSLNAVNTTKGRYKLSVIGLGWGLPAVVVIVIAATGNYERIQSVQMCWLTNTDIHYIVNIGYYALIFIFTSAIFIVIVRRITHTRLTKHGIIKTSSKRTGMIFSLFVLLGLTWGVAFFSYGPMLIPSYYIFTILNSFQGFFLFLYYYFYRNEDVDMGQSSSDSSLKKTNGTNTTTSTIEEKEN